MTQVDAEKTHVPQQEQGGHRAALIAGLLIALGIAVSYAETFRWMWRRWFPAWPNTNLSLFDRFMEGESYYTHGPLVPLVSLVIAVVLIRHTKIRVRPAPVLGGIVLAMGFSLHLVSRLARVDFASGFSLVPVLFGLVLIVWGREAFRRLWFPITFLLFAVPLPDITIGQLNFRLKMMAADTGVKLTNVLGIIAERSGNKVFLEDGKSMVVANVCNGLRTLISLLAFGALYAYVCKLRGLWRWVLFAASVPVAVVSNSIRIVAIIVVGAIWDVETATGWFHDMSGVLIYAVAFTLMFSIETLILGVRQLVGRPVEVLPLLHGVKRGPEDEGQWSRMAAGIGSRRVWAVVGVLAIVAAGSWWLGLTVPSIWNGTMVRDALPQTVEIEERQLDSYEMELDERVLIVLQTRDYILRRYEAPAYPWLDFCVIFSEDNRMGTHPPDMCLEGGGQDIIAKEDVTVHRGDGLPPLPCRELIVSRGSVKDYHLYTYRCGDSYTNSFWRQQMTIVVNGLLNRNASGALIRVSTPIVTDVDRARQRSKELLAQAMPHLDRALK